MSFFFRESWWFMIDSCLVHDWFKIGLRISWDSPFPRYLYLDIRNQDSVSSGHLILWRSCEVQTKKIDDSSVVSFWLKFALPSIIMGFSWKMGVSPIWVSFHLESHFPLKQICFTETIPKFRVNRWITDPNHLTMGVKGLSQLPNRNSLTREMQLIPEGAGVLPGWASSCHGFGT